MATALTALTFTVLTGARVWSANVGGGSGGAMAPVVSAGAASNADGSIFNVGQAAIGRATNGAVDARIGAVALYAPRPVVDVPGNCVNGSDVNLEDYKVLHDCVTGPDGGLDTACLCADNDDDGDVDLFDFSLFLEFYAP